MALHKKANKTIWPFYSIRGLKCPINYSTTVKYSYFLDLEFKMCLPTSAMGLGEVMEAQTVVKMLPDCSPVPQEQIETLISKI